ncbi:MAG: hypothetical protein SGPRY_003013, partial [Prymnesium sp.]
AEQASKAELCAGNLLLCSPTSKKAKRIDSAKDELITRILKKRSPQLEKKSSRHWLGDPVPHVAFPVKRFPIQDQQLLDGADEKQREDVEQLLQLLTNPDQVAIQLMRREVMRMEVMLRRGCKALLAAEAARDMANGSSGEVRNITWRICSELRLSASFTNLPSTYFAHSQYVSALLSLSLLTHLPSLSLLNPYLSREGLHIRLPSATDP